MKSKDDTDAIVDAMIESAAMDELRDYLARGRAYSSLSDDDLSERWVKAFKTWAASAASAEGPGDSRDMDDFHAEQRFRHIEPPYEKIRKTQKAIVERTKQLGWRTVDGCFRSCFPAGQT